MDILQIELDKDFRSKDQYFEYITRVFKERKFIKPGYEKAIKDREDNYPTGLNPGEIKVAIPHTDYEYSNVTGISITTLKNPINFNLMDIPNEEVGISIIIHILFDSPEKQIKMLQEIISLIQNQDLLKKLMDCKTEEEVYKIINNF